MLSLFLLGFTCFTPGASLPGQAGSLQAMDIIRPFTLGSHPLCRPRALHAVLPASYSSRFHAILNNFTLLSFSSSCSPCSLYTGFLLAEFVFPSSVSVSLCLSVWPSPGAQHKVTDVYLYIHDPPSQGPE